MKRPGSMSRRLRIAACLLAALHGVFLFADFVAPYPYDEQHRDHSYEPPGSHFFLGTDGLGRDVFSRVLYGGRISILAGLLATLLALGIGTVAGVLAGFFRGWGGRRL